MNRSTKSTARPSKIWPRPTLPAIALTLLASACSSSLPTTPATTVPPPQRPPLPANARQTQPPLSICLPTCSDALTKEREIWRQRLMRPG